MKDTNNSEQFLSTFNELEKHFKNVFFRGQWKSFKQMLKEGSRFNPIIKQFKEELFEFTDLRNAIVHNRSHDYQVIAEPHDFVVKQFAEITETIMNPIKVNKFCRIVHTCNVNDKVEVPIELIYKYKISQIPVLDEQGNVYEILNATNIAYWIASSSYKVSKEHTLNEILVEKEYKKNFDVIAEDLNVYDAADLYKQSYKKNKHNKYYDAILITRSGLQTESIKGIIVLSDIAKYI